MVEVSLDISFDVMITECAPIDAMIQRFGRINRRRSNDTIGKYKPIYVISPLKDKDALPYDPDVLERSFEVLPNDTIMNETEIQTMTPKEQTVEAFKRHQVWLEEQGLSLSEHCMRTWLFVRDIDTNYQEVVEGRNDVFCAWLICNKS